MFNGAHASQAVSEKLQPSPRPKPSSILTPTPPDRTANAAEPGACLPTAFSPFQTYTLAQGLCLDARRALWYAPARTLVVADLHLGYAWAQRKAGLLLPLSPGDDTVDRLEALLDCYRPEQL